MIETGAAGSVSGSLAPLAFASPASWIFGSPIARSFLLIFFRLPPPRVMIAIRRKADL